MNGAKFPKGCAGAVWSDGSYSRDYCTNTGYAKGRFPWYKKCCKPWTAGMTFAGVVPILNHVCAPKCEPKCDA